MKCTFCNRFYLNGYNSCPKCGHTFTLESLTPCQELPRSDKVNVTLNASNLSLYYNDSELIINAERLSKMAKYSKIESFTHLVEEVGEVGTCLNNEITHRKDLKEPLRNECVDVINCALELFFKDGGTIAELNSIAKEKQAKWEQNLQKMK